MAALIPILFFKVFGFLLIDNNCNYPNDKKESKQGDHYDTHINTDTVFCYIFGIHSIPMKRSTNYKTNK